MNKDMDKKQGSVLGDAILEAESLIGTIKENTQNMSKQIVEEGFRKFLNEAINEVEEEEVEDTFPQDNEEGDESAEGGEEGGEEFPTEAPEESSDDEFAEEEEGTEDFSDFKVGDDTYDLSNVQEDDFIKVFKKLKDDDTVIVKQEGGSVEIKDNETGAEYLIQGVDGDSPETTEEDFGEVSLDDDGDEELYDVNVEEGLEVEDSDSDEMISEYDSHVGYTDDYQKKTAMTTDGTNEPAKAGETKVWDKGVPTGADSTRPYGGPVKDATPFEETVDENLTRTKANLRQRGSKKSEPQKKNTNQIRVDGVRDGSQLELTNEVKTKLSGLLEQVKVIEAENREYKKTLKVVREALQEANLTNHKMGCIIKLVSENTTTVDEKKTIIERVNKAQSKEQITMLYEAMTQTLRSKPTTETNLNETFSLDSGNLLNEKTIYMHNDVNPAISLMDRMDFMDMRKK